MGFTEFTDMFKSKEFKQTISNLTKDLDSANKKHEDLIRTFTPEMRDATKIKELIITLNNEVQEINHVIELKTTEAFQLNEKIIKLEQIIKEKEKNLVILDESILFQEFALYEPQFDFASSELYKKELDSIRAEQKLMIKNEKAVFTEPNFTVDGSKAKGRKMNNDISKLLIRSFNSECDEIIGKVKYNNYDQSCKRMSMSFASIKKLSSTLHIEMSEKYLKLKLKEITVAFEYAQMKQVEKEEQQDIKNAMREEARVQKELEEARKDAQKEKSHYENALAKARKQLESALLDDEKQILEQKILELNSRLHIVEDNLKDIDYREANKRAGYVYVISNIGSFGDNIYKIGMTRRLNPQERVDELGDASVPFQFDVHALIFTDDAPKLENALHVAFENKKINMVNKRREFFNVSLDDIKQVITENFDKSVDFIDLPNADQYRESVKLKQKLCSQSKA